MTLKKLTSHKTTIVHKIHSEMNKCLNNGAANVLQSVKNNKKPNKIPNTHTRKMCIKTNDIVCAFTSHRTELD